VIFRETAEPASWEFKRRVRGVIVVQRMWEVAAMPAVGHTVIAEQGELHDRRHDHPILCEVAAAIIRVNVDDAVGQEELLEHGLV